MGKRHKWDTTADNKDLDVVLFTSRNKDNKHIENFKERRISFVTNKTPRELLSEFEAFVKNGLDGEMSRFYISVNPRSNTKVQKALIHYLIDNEINIAKLPSILASIASNVENRHETEGKNWLFDFDPIDDMDTKLNKFIDDIIEEFRNTKTKKQETRPEPLIITHKTPNGYAVVVNNGFDTRKLLEKWTNVSLKKDAMLCFAWKMKGE